MALQRPCIDGGEPTTGTRCPFHQSLYEKRRHNRQYDSPAWRRFRTRVLAAWRHEHGNWCPGDLPEHPAHDVIPPDILTLDHSEGVDAGLFGPTRVLCRTWNGVLGGRAVVNR